MGEKEVIVKGSIPAAPYRPPWVDDVPTRTQCVQVSPELLNKVDTDGSHFLEERLVEVIKQIYTKANESERFFSECCKDQWLRTAIVMKDVDAVFSPAPLPEVLAKMEIHSNVLPCQAYWTALQSVKKGPPCGGREFVTISILEEALKEKRALKEMLSDWRERGGNCVLEEQLQQRLLEADQKKVTRELLQINYTDVDTVELIGSGTEGTVYKIIWRKGIFARKNFHSPDVLFNDEAEIARRVNHPHVVHTFGLSFAKEKEKFLLMELLQNDLYEHIFAIKRKRPGAAPFEPLEALYILLQIAQAMKHLHDVKVVHGDLKSKNILISKFEISGDVRHTLVKVADFGSAQLVDSSNTSSFKPKPGTTEYAAPEVLRCRPSKSTARLQFPYKVDVYSFGVVASEVLTGDGPYFDIKVEMSMRQIMDGVKDGTLRPKLQEFDFHYPKRLISLVEECWDGNPEKRPTFNDICDRIKRLTSLAERGNPKSSWPTFTEFCDNIDQNKITSSTINDLDRKPLQGDTQPELTSKSCLNNDGLTSHEETCSAPKLAPAGSNSAPSHQENHCQHLTNVPMCQSKLARKGTSFASAESAQECVPSFPDPHPLQNGTQPKLISTLRLNNIGLTIHEECRTSSFISAESAQQCLSCSPDGFMTKIKNVFFRICTACSGSCPCFTLSRMRPNPQQYDAQPKMAPNSRQNNDGLEVSQQGS